MGIRQLALVTKTLTNAVSSLTRRQAMMPPSAYTTWSTEDLIARIQSLENVLADVVPPGKIPLPAHTPHSVRRQKKKTWRKGGDRPFDFDAHPRRKIALKFCYSGWEYNGLTYQKQPTPLPMVEEVILEALAVTRLIDGEKGIDGCGWSRCGRTDKGVSGAGQVAALWVRSALGGRKNREAVDEDEEEEAVDADTQVEGQAETRAPAHELRYVHMLNSVLPTSIRILAWSPVADEFDARFSCTHRHYKYFFSPWIPPHGPSSPPSPATLLDISAMKDAASRMIGLHDFRNFCKIDPSKQIDNYKRRIMHTSITPLDPFDVSKVMSSDDEVAPPMYVFDLKGNGFLWHQVRHIMAILFLIGCRMESPSIVDALFNTDEQNPITASDGGTLPLVPAKPTYEMADGLPLVLWDCGYGETDVAWQTDADSPNNHTKTVTHAVRHSAEQIHLDFQQQAGKNLIQMAMQNHFAMAAGVFHPLGGVEPGEIVRIPLGAGSVFQAGRHIPVLERPRGGRVEELNERWRNGAGAKKMGKKTVGVAGTGGNVESVA